ncbi:hypothetical protein M446_6970 (plasmid) [Methylobacterium sp. 4-46]|uniref:hypothetical protein n=1 Tax=unclassified Methylobacterium TaxID=2615210 RepID=UPI000165CBFA|nr:MULTISPECIES: hypothetical protein [Methylobacterium]ACA21203.1 hypothetical protein M446_6970 [Methylobacterium sp. 4-46]WFT83773.1 hypothetical protein QA634_35455 [Methylobacterium nodulans]
MSNKGNIAEFWQQAVRQQLDQCPALRSDSQTGSPVVAALRSATSRAAEISAAFGRIGERTRRDPHLTEAGKRDKITTVATRDTLGPLRRTQREVAEVKAQVAAKRAACVVRRGTDPVEEMRRQEVRAFLRSLPDPGKRIGAAMQDPEIARAVVEASPMLSGMDAANYQRIHDEVVKAEHGDVLAELDGLKEVIQYAENIMAFCHNSVRDTLGENRETDKLIADFNKEYDAS